jgi:hypothetical protein
MFLTNLSVHQKQKISVVSMNELAGEQQAEPRRLQAVPLALFVF